MKQAHNGKSSNIVIIAVLIVLCAVASLTVLFGKMISYSQTEFKNVMPLISVDGNSPNAPAQHTESAQSAVAQQPALSQHSVSQGTGSHPEFHMNAEAEIFKISYENDKGEIIVKSPDDSTDKLIAPGTTNKYQFTLENPGNVALDYTLSMEAYITGTDEIIPVNVRVWDYTNKYLLGSAEQMVDVLDLNTVDEKSVLGAGRYAAYTLEWEWPYEQDNDEFDTMLGNMAVDDDLVLTIKINTTAEYDEDPDNNKVGLIVPQTGDDSSLEYLWMILAMSVIGIFIVLFADRKKKKQDSKNTQSE